MIAPLLLLAIVLGGTAAVGTSAAVLDTASPPMVVDTIPLPTPRPASVPKAKPQHHKAKPQHVVAPPAPVAQPPAPPPDATPVVPQEEPRVVLPSPIEPSTPTTQPESPIHMGPVDMARAIAWTIVKTFLWTLLFGGCGWAIWKGARDIIAIRKSDQLGATK